MEHCVNIQYPTFDKQSKIPGKRQEREPMGKIYSRGTDQANPES